MTTALFVIVLLTAANARQDRTDSSEFIVGPRVDIMGDGDGDVAPSGADAFDEGVELQAALFGDWTMAGELL